MIRFPVIALLCLLQAMLPYVHAHVGGGHEGVGLHISGAMPAVDHVSNHLDPHPGSEVTVLTALPERNDPLLEPGAAEQPVLAPHVPEAIGIVSLAWHAPSRPSGFASHQASGPPVRAPPASPDPF